MIRPLLLSVALSLALAGCKPSALQTIEEGEAYAQAHGVVLTEKKENKDQIVAPRGYKYNANGVVHLDILQFNTDTSASEWRRLSDELPVSGDTRIQRGIVMFVVSGATDTDRQKVIGALK